MSVRKATLLFLIAWVSTSLQAETIQIGSGSVVNQGLPLEPFTAYSYSQQLFLAQEIGPGGIISAIGFQYQVAHTAFLSANCEVKFYLGHSSRTLLNSWIPIDSLSLVFDGTLTQENFSSPLPGSGWLTVNLANPFIYNGIDNLIVACDENTPGSSSSSDEFLATPIAVDMAVLFKSSTINPDPMDPPPEQSAGYFVRQHRSNLRLEIEQEFNQPHAPSPEHNAAEIGNTGLNLFWQSDADAFDLFFGSAPQQMIQLASQITESGYVLQDELALLCTYYWQVIAYKNSETFIGNIWQFSTAGETLSAPQNLTGIAIGDHAHLTWQAPEQGTIVEYEIHRNNQLLDRTPSLSYSDYNISGGLTYHYCVKAVNYLNQVSPPSNTVSVSFYQPPVDHILNEDFEGLAAFSTAIPGWQMLDLDGSQTWHWDSIDFPLEGTSLAWMVFAPGQTVPPLTGLAPQQGSQMLISMSATTPPNNDWLILPRSNLGSDPVLKFWARSYTADYGLERLRVLLSTTDANPASFVPLSSSPYLEIPDAWTEYSFELSDYQHSNVYIALNCVSWDAFALFVDNVSLCGESGYVSVFTELNVPSPFLVYPNPSSKEFNLRSLGKSPFSVRLYDLRGRRLYRADGLKSFNSKDAGLDLSPGVYLLKVADKTTAQTIKVLISK